MGFRFDLLFFLFPDLRFWRGLWSDLGVILDPTVDAVEAPGEQGGLEVGDAAQAPLGVGELADEAALQGGRGLEFLLEFGQQRLEVFGIFAGQDRAVGRQAVGEGVVAGDGFAFGGARAGAELGVAAAGVGALVGALIG